MATIECSIKTFTQDQSNCKTRNIGCIREIQVLGFGLNNYFSLENFLTKEVFPIKYHDNFTSNEYAYNLL